MHDLSHYGKMNTFHKDNETNKIIWLVLISALITIGTCIQAVSTKEDMQTYEQTQPDYDDTIMYQ